MTRCPRCGAAVAHADELTHDVWHDDLDRRLEYLAERLDKQGA